MPSSITQRAFKCRPCFGLSQRGLTKSRTKTFHGYIVLGGMWDHPNTNKRGQVLEHTKVMSDMIGRALLPGENVHHKNGVRDDNRPENLELWITSQPYGQRVSDQVAWAREILARYEAVVDANASPERPHVTAP